MIDVEFDARVVGFVQRHPRRPSTQLLRPSTVRDFEIHTLRIILRAVIAIRLMQRYDLVSQHISPRLQPARQRDVPRVVGRDQ